jgi:parallel beta-helix repeat protein
MRAARHGSIAILVPIVLSGVSCEEALRSDLQGPTTTAKPGGVVTVAPGVHRGSITINKPVILKGETPEQCVLELTADRPAVLISSKDPVTIDSVTIQWQLATSEGHKGPACALAVKDGNAVIKNCRFIALGGTQRCPSAVQCLGFSNVTISNCTFEGFEFTVGYTGGSEGSITDCVFLNPGHCGVTVYSGSKVDVARNIITGSGYHGLRCTGGTLLAYDNLIIKNNNRGIYLGNKSARGRISNNVILGNGTGISAFAQTDTTIENNLILDSSFAGFDARDSCPVTVRNNIFQKNTRGIAIFKEVGRNQVSLGQNTFWENGTDTENVERPANSILVDPRLEAPAQGGFAPQADEVKTNNQGLSDPSVFGPLWEKWTAIGQGS